MPESEPQRTIEIVFSDDSVRRVTIPASWKVTFGAIVPTARAAEAGGYGGWGLRIYEAQDRQRAVFTGVHSFYDVAIEQKVHAIRKFGTDEWFKDDGSWTEARRDLVQFDWIDYEDVAEGKPPYYTEGLPDHSNEEPWATAVASLKPSRSRAMVAGRGRA